MKKIHSLALVAGGLAVAGVLVTPSAGVGFTTIGGSLGIQAAASGNGFQRDVRVFNNAADSQANNNVTADPLFPGALGAPLAVPGCTDAESRRRLWALAWASRQRPIGT